MSRDSRYLESILHHDIPLTREMGLKVIAWHDKQLRLQLPLEANINHKSTMFGGTAHTAAEVVRLVGAGADYIGCGPFKTSTTKVTDLTPLGTTGLSSLMEEVNPHLSGVPIIAVGGITAADITALMDAGVFGVAASSAINQAEDMGEAYREFYAQLR